MPASRKCWGSSISAIWPTASPTSCPAASSSAWRSPVRWRRSRRCFCSTSRCRRSTPRSASPCARKSAMIQQQLGITTVFVTHDQEEALSISDRIVVMNAGRADQIGTPFDIYNRPATRFVASFVGTLNLIEGTVVDPAANRISIGRPGYHAAGAARPGKGRRQGFAGAAAGSGLDRRRRQGRHGADRAGHLQQLPRFGHPHAHEGRRARHLLRHVQRTGPATRPPSARSSRCASRQAIS